MTQHSSQSETRTTSSEDNLVDVPPPAPFAVGRDGGITPVYPPNVVQGYVTGYITLANPFGYTGYVWATQNGQDKCSEFVHLPPGEEAMEPGRNYKIRLEAVNQDFIITTTPPSADGQAKDGGTYGTNGDIRVGTPPNPGDGHGPRHRAGQD